jgi:hypothetical protein
MEMNGQLHASIVLPLRKEPTAFIRGEFGHQVWWEREEFLSLR